jgi:hypothetical protein
MRVPQLPADLIRPIPLSHHSCPSLSIWFESNRRVLSYRVVDFSLDTSLIFVYSTHCEASSYLYLTDESRAFSPVRKEFLVGDRSQ